MNFPELKPKEFVQEVVEYILTEDEGDRFFIKKGSLKIVDFRGDAEVDMGAETSKSEGQKWYEALDKIRKSEEWMEPKSIQRSVTDKIYREDLKNKLPKELNELDKAYLESRLKEEAYKKVGELIKGL